MSKSVALPDDLYDRAAEVAAADHQSVDELVAAMLADRIATRDFIEARARLFNREEFKRVLAQVPDVEPDENDRI